MQGIGTLSPAVGAATGAAQWRTGQEGQLLSGEPQAPDDPPREPACTNHDSQCQNHNSSQLTFQQQLLWEALSHTQLCDYTKKV